MVIDSKVSLIAYSDALAAEDEAEQERLMKAHALSVRKHIDELAAKDYSKLVDDAIGFVLMFIHTEAIHQLNFEEAAELAYFGAKILHPTCVQPAKYAGIPVRLKNTLDPDAEGTIIDNVLVRGKIKAVAAKDNIIAIKIKSSRMLLATGFLRKVFEIFESYQTPIDMIATSEVGVSMSIDNDAHLNEIVDELKKYGTVTVDTDMCIICVVGDLDWSNLGFETLATEAMKNIPVRMISYGGSNYNISFLIREADKKRALQSLSDTLFNNK